MAGVYRQLMQQMQEMQETIRTMAAEIRELKAGASSPTLPDEATDDDLFYILRTKGREAYGEALKARNKQRARRYKERMAA